MVKKSAGFVLVCLSAFGLAGGTAHAQSRTDSTTYIQTAPPAEPTPKRFRLYLEDILAANLSYDLNPESRGLIVSPSVGVLYVFPQIGLNARTPGPRYVSFGATQNFFIAPPILQISYGQQWRTSFFEVGLLTLEPTGARRAGYDGPQVVPRLVLGMRF